MQWLATSRTSLQCCERKRHDAKELLITSKSHVGDVVIANSNFFAEKAEKFSQINPKLYTVKSDTEVQCPSDNLW